MGKGRMFVVNLGDKELHIYQDHTAHLFRKSNLNQVCLEYPLANLVSPDDIDYFIDTSPDDKRKERFIAALRAKPYTENGAGVILMDAFERARLIRPELVSNIQGLVS